jgi:hypothetical protein
VEDLGLDALGHPGAVDWRRGSYTGGDEEEAGSEQGLPQPSARHEG